MAVSKTFEMAFIVGAALQSNFATVMDKAQKKVSLIEKGVKSLNRANADIKSVIARRQATEKAQKAWVTAEAQAKKLQSTILGMSQPNESLIRSYNKMEVASVKAKNAWLEQKRALIQVEQQTKSTGFSVNSLIRSQERLERQSKRANKAFALYQRGKQNLVDSRGYMAGTGIAILAKMQGVISTGADFDSAMARVGAVSGASGDDLKALREQAKSLGESTVWSASQAAQGQQFLAMAGFSKDQILKSMPGMLDLASAGGIELGSAADIGSNILTGMGLDAGEMGRVGDVLVNTFTKSNTSLAMLGDTMKYAAPVAKSVGVSLEEAAAMAGKLGDAGIQGTMAGTTLRTILLRLSAPSQKGAQALDALGVKTTDAAGNLRRMPEILADLNTAMAEMPEAQRAAYTKAIFETEAMSGAFVLMEQAGKGALQEFTEAVRRSGSAKQVAADQNNNLVGDFKNLTSAIEGVTIAFYEKMEPTLRDLTQWGTKVVGMIKTWIQDFPTVTKYIGLTAVGIGGLTAAAIPAFTLFKSGQFIFGMFQASLGAARLAMLAFNVAAAANPIGVIVLAIGAAVAAGVLLYKNWDTVKAKALELWAGIQAAFSGVGEFIGTAFQSAVSMAKTPINAMISMVNSIIEKVNEYSSIKVPSWVPGIGGEGLGFQLTPIPQLADGGIATRSTLANIGEGSEPEAVLPLSRLNSMLSAPTAGSSVNINLTVNVQGSGAPSADIQQAARAASFNLRRELERLLANERRLAY